VHCPFLREARVRGCLATPCRKLLADGPPGARPEICSAGGWQTCPAYHEPHHLAAEGASCPWLEEKLMQYCALSAVPKMVPYSESGVSRCWNDTHRYCEMYLEMARPHPAGRDDAITAPAHLSYSANHMWIDAGESGICHIGVDAFLARALGRLDRISYVRTHGLARPAAVLSAAGADIAVAFPAELYLEGANLYLRGNPARLQSDPYGAGWLFVGRAARQDAREGLTTGAPALAWMNSEITRMNQFLQSCGPARNPGAAALCDGGLFEPGVSARLSDEDRFRLFHDFFGPGAGRGLAIQKGDE
jgi:glycine cleavage system H protein